ncbi:hypothetical protein GALL_542700 [mine drainage metagenome]|uniref:Uncharacterized protein n=1 Tax=mine drainage metagenome TaxID=410659 RepID=A0A1J5P9M0_9ZZZZ
MHGSRGQYKNTFQSSQFGALLNAFEHPLAVALTLHLGRHRQRRHFGGAGFRIGIERGAGKNNAVVFDHRVQAHVAFDFGAAAFDQGAIFLKRFNQLQNATDIIDTGFTQTFQLFIDHHGANAIVHIDFQQDRAVYRKRNDVAAFNPAFARLDAVLQVKRSVAGLVGIG